MFRRGLVFQSECPDPHCSRVNCHFLHPQASKHITADDSSAKESGWKLLQDLKQVPLTQHDSYVPSVHTGVSVESSVDTVHSSNNDNNNNSGDDNNDGDDHPSALNAVSSRGVKRKMSGDTDEQHNKRVKHSSDSAADKSDKSAATTTAHRTKPDLMGPLIPSKKFTVDNFLGAVSDASPTAQPISAQSKSARQRINPSSQSLSSATCPIVPYTPNSHIERAVRQKVVDRLYAHLTRVNSSEAVQQALDLELEIYRSCQGRTSYTHQARVLFSELERK